MIWTPPRLYLIYRGGVTPIRKEKNLLTAFLTMWNKSTETVKCKKLIIEEGALVDIDGEQCQMLAVVTADDIYHPVVSVEVM